MRYSLKTTLMHSLELLVVLIASYIVVQFIAPLAQDHSSELVYAVVTLIIGTLAKYTRATPANGVEDYVNTK